MLYIWNWTQHFLELSCKHDVCVYITQMTNRSSLLVSEVNPDPATD